MQKKRYWGLAVFSIIWMFAIVLLNAAAGRTGTSFTTVLWALVAFYAITGNVSAIASVAKWISILQIVVGTIFFFVLTSNADMQLYFGTPAEFVLGIGIPTFVWIALYFWANGKATSQLLEPSNKNTTEINYSSMTKNSQSEAITKANEAPVIDSRPKFSPPSPDDTVAAQILLKHDKNVKSTIQGLDGLPTEIVEKVLIEIVKHPSENLQTVRNRALLVALGRPDMKWSDEFDLIIRKCKDAGIEDVTEFFHVFPVLSRRMTPIEVFRKLITEKVSEFYVTAASGKQILVTQHGTNSFTFQSHLGQKIFGTIEEVYEYLGTPNSKRR